MDVTTVTTLIGSFGFPIVACIAMAWYINNTHKELIDCLYTVNRTLKAVLQELNIKDDSEEK